MFSRHGRQCEGSKLMRDLCPLFELAYITKFKILNQLANTYLLTYLLTYSLTLLTPWNRVLLQNLICLQLVKKFPAFYGTRSFITAFTSVYQLSLSWASSIQPIPPHPTFWRSILILSTHLRSVWIFRNKIRFYGEKLLPPRPNPKLENHSCRVSSTAFLIYWQLPSLLEAVPPSTHLWRSTAQF